MKRLLSIVLSAVLLMGMMLSVSAAPVATDINVAYSAFNVTVKVQVPTEVTGKMIAQIIDASGTEMYAMGVQTVATEENSIRYYVFNFTMPADITTGNYKVRIGNNVATTEKTFEYKSINDVLGFYNGLIDVITATDGDVSAYLSAPTTEWPLGAELLASYTGIANANVKTLVNNKIKAIPTSTTYPAAAGALVDYDSATMLANASAIASSNYDVFEAVVVDAIAVALLADVTDTTWETTVTKAIDGTLFTGTSYSSTTFDNKYYTGTPALLTLSEVYPYFNTERNALVTAGSLNAADYEQAFDEATLLLIENDPDSNSSWLEDAFLYYEGNGVITVDMTDVDALVAADKDADLWKDVKALDNTDVDTLIDNVETIAAQMVADGVLNSNPGDSDTDTPITGGGSPGGAGGSSTITKPSNPGASTGIIPDEKEEDETPKATFSDLSQAEWAREAVEYFAAKGVISGKAEDTFAPNDSVTREEGAKIIAGAFDAVENSASCDFTDVSADRWSYTYIASAVRLGIIQGDGDSFRPADTMTREEMATIFYRLYKLLGLEIQGTAKSFSDDSQISPWAREAVAALSGAGIIDGMGDGTFSPKEPVTRAQLAKVAYEIVKLLGGDQ